MSSQGDTTAARNASADSAARPLLPELRERLLREGGPFLHALLDSHLAVAVTLTGNVVLANDAAAEMLLMTSGSELWDRAWPDFMLPEDARELERRIEEVQRSSQSLPPAVHRVRRKNGTLIDVEITSVPVELFGLHFILSSARNVSEGMRMKRMLAHSEAQLLEAQRIADLGSWELDLNTGELSWSQEVFRMLERDPASFRASYEAFLQMVHPEDRARVHQAYEESVKSKTRYTVTHRLQMPDGRIKHVQERGETYYGSDGTPLRSLGTMQDVTGRVLAEESMLRERALLQGLVEEKEVLLREVHHRVKNNLQIVSSLLYLQQDEAESATVVDSLRESSARVAAMALIHEALYGSRDLARVDMFAYTQELTRHLLSSYCVEADERVPLEIRGDRFMLELDRATPCGLILNELVTNAVKHAFPDGRKGRIEITLKEQPDSFEIEIGDDGIGHVNTPRPRSSLGLRLVSRLSAQLGAELTRVERPGTHYQLRLPREPKR